MALDFQAPQRFLTLELMKPIQVGLLGIGTVGSGTFNVLERNQDEIRRRAGRGIEIAMVADLDTARAKSVVGDKAKVVGDAREIIANPVSDYVADFVAHMNPLGVLTARDVMNARRVVATRSALEKLQEALG